MTIKIGDKAPNFTLADTNEKSIALKDYSTKSILVVILILVILVFMYY